MTRYLLGQLPEAERDAREQEWFTDKVQYVQLCEAETALIDAYVRGDLRGEERTLFEQHFLPIPARRERVNTARALLHLIDQPAVQAEAWWQRWRTAVRVPKLIPALAMTAVVLLLAGGLWLLLKSGPNREEAAQPVTPTVEPARPTPQPTQLAQAPVTPAPAAPKTTVFALTAGVLRSEGHDALPTLKLAHGIERVQLQVKLPAHEYKQFTATLRTAEGGDVQRWTVKAAGTRLSLSLAAQQLKAGDYVLVVRGINAPRAAEEFRQLPFQVRR